MRETNVAVNKLLGIVVNGKKLIGLQIFSLTRCLGPK